MNQWQENAGCYLNNRICITFSDERPPLFGVLREILGGTWPEALLVEGPDCPSEPIPGERIRDVEFVGEITEYHSRQNWGEIGPYQFARKDLLPSFDYSKLAYKEFDCQVCCHLVFTGSSICARDVRLLKAVHSIACSDLARRDYLYLFEDGTSKIGCLEGQGEETTLSGETVDWEQIADITRAPQVNDIVTVQKKDGTMLRGVVSTAAREEFALISGRPVMPVRVRYEEIKTLRFSGYVKEIDMVQRAAKILVNNMPIPFFCKMQEEELSMLEEGKTVSFVAGASKKGIIAKELAIEKTESGEQNTSVLDRVKEIPEQIGIIVFWGDLKLADPYGYIGNSYVDTRYCRYIGCKQPRGDVSFYPKRTQGVGERDPNLIYVVSYSGTVDQQNGHKVASTNSISVVKTFDRRKYVKVWVEEDGTIGALPFSVAYLALLAGKDVEIICKDGSVRKGRLESYDMQKAVLKGETESIPAEEIADVRAYGTLSSYDPSGRIGWINAYWFHANSLRDPEQAVLLEKGRRASYILIGAQKGDGVAAAEVEVYGEAAVQGELTAYDGINCTVISEGETTGKSYALDWQASKEQTDKLNALVFGQGEAYPVTYFLREEFQSTYIVIKNIGTVAQDLDGKDDPGAPKELDGDRLLLSEIPREGMYPDGAVQYGLLVYYSSGYAKIVNNYIRSDKREKADEAVNTESSTLAVFYPKQTQRLGLAEESKPKTTKYVYLVCYVPGGKTVNVKTGEEEPAVDGNYPVEFLQEYLKEEYVSLRIENDCLVLKKVENQFASETEQQSAVPIPPLQKGESVFFIKTDKFEPISFRKYLGETEDSYLLERGETLSKAEIKKIYRFGVVTDFQYGSGRAMLNGSIGLSLKAMDTSLINILNSQAGVVQLHVIFAHEGDRVVEVCRISNEYLSKMPWSIAEVTRCSSAERKITINGNVDHYTSVLTDGAINNARKDKDNPLLGQRVLFREVSQLWCTEKSRIQLINTAVYVRCEKEVGTVQYDAGRDIYLGFRNPTFSYPLNGSATALQAKIGERVEVKFRRSADLLGIEAWLDSEDEEMPLPGEEEHEEDMILGDLAGEALAAFCFAQIDLSQMSLRDIAFDEHGMPKDLEQAQTAYRILQGRSDSDAILAQAKLMWNFPDLQRTQSRGRILMSAFEKRCKKIEKDNNSVYGEWVYYLTVLLCYKGEDVKAGRNRTEQMTAEVCRYLLFSQDFYARNVLRKRVEEGKLESLQELLRHPCTQVNEFVAHIVPLDKNNTDAICGALEKEAELDKRLREYAAATDDTIQSGSMPVIRIVEELQNRYRKDKNRFAKSFAEAATQEEVCAKCAEILKNMQVRFLKLVCSDDAARFERLKSCCEKVCDCTKGQAGVAQREDILKNTYRDVCELEKDILDHPCRESVELLMVNGPFTPERNVLSQIKEEISILINQICRNESTKPRISCYPNEATIPEGEEKMWLVVKNDDDVLPAKDIVLSLQSIQEGISVSPEVKLSSLAAGEQKPVEIDLVWEGQPDLIRLNCGISFAYDAGFQDGQIRQEKYQQQDTILDLQVGQVNTLDKTSPGGNPYEGPAKGNPLEGKEMFFGRKNERREIWESIVRPTEEGEELIPGSTVIIFGQKKCGKTSLVNQVRNSLMDSEDLRKQAIFLNFNDILVNVGGAEALSRFHANFYGRILARFKRAIYNDHPDVLKLLEENHLEIPDLGDRDNVENANALFEDFIQDFSRLDGKKHTIVLLMDEFTRLCTTVCEMAEKDETLATVPTFIKTFSSQYGFVQLIIGHEAMMRAFARLGVINHTAEFAKTIEIAALERKDAEMLIREPMEKAFGTDVYQTELGRRAVERMLDLSGCNPTYLMRLCDKMFRYYTNVQKCPREQIILSDVNAVAKEYIQELTLEDFDILLVEDGDKNGDLERRRTYQYLKVMALESAKSYDRRTTEPSTVKRELMKLDKEYSEKLFEETKDLLVNRRVISVNGGRAKINVGLFQEFIIQTNGG